VANRAVTVALPRLPADLSPAPPQSLIGEDEWSGCQLSGDLAALAVAGLEVRQCRAHDTSLTAAQLPRARFIDVVFTSCELSGANMTEATLRRVEFRDCRLQGTTWAQAQLHDVRFADCRMDDSDFRMTTGERVEFDDCRLARSDFYAARLAWCRLFDCDLTGAQFSQADLSGARMHGSRLDDVGGAQYLKGVTISSAQILPMALQLLPALGLIVDDEREPGSA
jgi:uncharacterized protein YjbI with pentapeptide repeats